MTHHEVEQAELELRNWCRLLRDVGLSAEEICRSTSTGLSVGYVEQVLRTPLLDERDLAYDYPYSEAP